MIPIIAAITFASALHRMRTLSTRPTRDDDRGPAQGIILVLGAVLPLWALAFWAAQL